MNWTSTRDGDARAAAIADRHYSRYKTQVGKKRFVGPGERIVLVTPDYSALFVWRKAKYRGDNQSGVECALFRNESSYLSSDLIREAMLLARERWPGERLFTYVNADKVQSRNPGFCFLKAGWVKVDHRSRKQNLILLEWLPHVEAS